MARKIVYYLYRHYDIAEDVVLKVVNPGGEEENMLTYTEMSEQLIEEGMQKGRQEGIEEGVQKGMQKGRKEGIEEGMQKGTSKALHTLARNMVAEGLAWFTKQTSYDTFA